MTPLTMVWHVGRQGEVAGGMTQVVNGYLAWAFEHVRVSVIRSRDGSSGPRAVWIFARSVVELLTRVRDPDRNVVVVHLSQGGSFVREGLLLWLAHRRGLATVAHLHGSSFVAFADRWPGLVRRVLGVADRVIVLSETSRTAVVRCVGHDRVVLVPNAVPPGRDLPKERLVVFGGGVGRRKGVDVLVEAWRRVGAGRGWQLVVAGPVLDREVVPSDLPDARFPGAVRHEVLMDLLDRSSVAMLPSRDEAMPMFVLEAMARANCVISTTVGGIPSVLRDGRGITVPPGDADALGAALDRVLRDDEWRGNIAATGKAAFDAVYSAAAVYPRVEALWLEVLMEKSRRPSA